MLTKRIDSFVEKATVRANLKVKQLGRSIKRNQNLKIATGNFLRLRLSRPRLSPPLRHLNSARNLSKKKNKRLCVCG